METKPADRMPADVDPADLEGAAPDPADLEHDELWASLGKLPAHDLAPERAARLATMAREELRRSSARRAPKPRRQSFYTRALEPAWVVALAAAQLGWAIERVIAIHGG